MSGGYLSYIPVLYLDCDVIAGAEHVNVWRHVDVQTAHFLLHLLGVDLAHVAAPICLHHLPDVQPPYLQMYI
jgi:hypothetical protein